VTKSVQWRKHFNSPSFLVFFGDLSLEQRLKFLREHNFCYSIFYLQHQFFSNVSNYFTNFKICRFYIILFKIVKIFSLTNIHETLNISSGVYMNKVELFRQGESTLERYYPPWMKVVYYRYLRFFPDGVVFMLTSSYDPITVISQLRSHGAQVEGMCRGMYRMKENQVDPLLLLLLLLLLVIPLAAICL